MEMNQSRQNVQISAPEEIAYIKGWINKDQLLEAADAYGKSPYGEHLHRVSEDRLRY